ncbi:polysaccharide deacetylase family protein [bacterium]|nr:polysaccharide deacetylase family protein [bacterium]
MIENGSMLRNEVPVLVFHKVDPAFEWGVTRVNPQHFRRILSVLKANHYQTVSLYDLFNQNQRLPEFPLVITFDDSYDSIYEYAYPILQEFGYTATVFVITGFAGSLNDWDVNLGGIKFRHLSWAKIKTLSESGFEIGSHTVHHPDLTRISRDTLIKELTQSKSHLEDQVGKPVHFISFPFGRYNDEVIHECRQAGYRHGCGFWIRKKNDLSFVFERKAYYLFDNAWSLKAKLDHHWGRVIENIKLRAVNFCSHGTSLVKPSKFERYNK